MNQQNRIQYYRKRAGLSQEELGERLYVSRQTVSQWETGQTVPSVDNLTRLRELFGVSVDELLGLTPPAETEAAPPASESPSEAEPYRFRYTADEYTALGRLHRRPAHLAMPVLLLTAVLTTSVAMAEKTGGTVAFLLWIVAAMSIYRYIQAVQGAKRDRAEVLSRIYTYTVTPQGLVLTVTSETDPIYRHETAVHAKDIRRVRTQGQLLLLYVGLVYYTLRLSETAAHGALHTHLLSLQAAALTSRGQGGHTAQKPLPAGVQVLSVLLVILSVGSLAGGVGLAALLAGDTPGRMAACLWVYYPLMLLPGACFALGCVLRKKGYGGKLNLVTGIVMCLLLGLFGTAFSGLRDAEDPVFVVESELGIAIPAYEFFNSSASAGILGDDLVSVDTIRFTDTDGDAFEATMGAPSHWLTAIPAALEDVQPPRKGDVDFDRFLLYDRTADRFNARPDKEGQMVALYYDAAYNVLTIVLYRWTG